MCYTCTNVNQHIYCRHFSSSQSSVFSLNMYIHTHADKLSSSCVFVLYDVYIVYRYKFTPFHTISIIYLHHASMSWLTVTVDYQSLYHCAWIINPLCFHLHSLTQLFPSSGKSRAWRLVDERHDLTVPIA